MKILIVEDNDHYANLVRKYLNGLATEIVVVHSWADAQRHVQMRYDVAWFDLHIPDAQISDMVLKIAEMRDKHQKTVIVVCSGYITEERKKELSAIGADVIADKSMVLNPVEITSLVMLGIMNAVHRTGDDEGLAKMLERASKFVAGTFTKQGA